MISKAAVVVQRNNYALTKRAIMSLWNQDVSLYLLVIDNNSEHSIARWVEHTHNQMLHHNTAVLRTHEQKSLAACWNIGIRIAWGIGCTEALVINNDIELHPATYRKLSEINRPFITPVNVGEDKKVLALAMPEEDEYQFDVHPDFSAFLIRKEVTDRVGFFDEAYWPAYCEDCDYHLRMQKAGIVAGSVNIPYIHRASSTLRYANEVEKRLIEMGAEANRIRFRKTWGCEPGTTKYEEMFTKVG